MCFAVFGVTTQVTRTNSPPEPAKTYGGSSITHKVHNTRILAPFQSFYGGKADPEAHIMSRLNVRKKSVDMDNILRSHMSLRTISKSGTWNFTYLLRYGWNPNLSAVTLPTCVCHVKSTTHDSKMDAPFLPAGKKWRCVSKDSSHC